MTITNSFKNAVKDENISLVRIMMKDSLWVDLTFNEYNEMEKIAKILPNLYDRHNNEVFESDKKRWNEDYLSTQRVRVLSNFSHERISHLKEVIRYLRQIDEMDSKNKIGETKTSKSRQNKNLNNDDYKQYNQNDERYIKNKVVIGTVIGGIVGGTVGCLVGTTVVGGVLIGAIVSGTSVLVIEKGVLK